MSIWRTAITGLFILSTMICLVVSWLYVKDPRPITPLLAFTAMASSSCAIMVYFDSSSNPR